MSAVESWFAPAVAAEPLPKRAPRKRASAARPNAKQRQWSGVRVRASLVWMCLFALLLVGVVAVNVAVLQANVSVNNLDKEITQLQQKNAQIASQYSRVTAPPRVEAAARKAGLVPAPGLDTTYLDLVRHK